METADLLLIAAVVSAADYHPYHSLSLFPDKLYLICCFIGKSAAAAAACGVYILIYKYIYKYMF